MKTLQCCLPSEPLWSAVSGVMLVVSAVSTFRHLVVPLVVDEQGAEAALSLLVLRMQSARVSRCGWSVDVVVCTVLVTPVVRSEIGMIFIK